MVHYKSALILICFTLALFTGSEARVIRRARTLDIVGQVSALTSEVNIIQTAIGTIESKIKGLTNLGAAASSNLEDIISAINELKPQLNGIVGQLGLLTGKPVDLIQAKLDTLQATVNKLKTTIDGVVSQLNTVTDTTLALVENKLKAALRLVYQIDDILGELDSTLLNTVSTKVTNLLSLTDGITDTLNEFLGDVVSTATGSVNKALGLTKDIKAKLVKIQNTLKTLTGNVEGQLQSILKNLNDLEGDLNLAQEVLQDQGVVKIDYVVSLLGTILNLVGALLGILL